MADNGVGLPEGMDLLNPESLGLELVRILSGQLGGSVEFGRGEGTEIRTRLKCERE